MPGRCKTGRRARRPSRDGPARPRRRTRRAGHYPLHRAWPWPWLADHEVPQLAGSGSARCLRHAGNASTSLAQDSSQRRRTLPTPASCPHCSAHSSTARTSTNRSSCGHNPPPRGTRLQYTNHQRKKKITDPQVLTIALRNTGNPLALYLANLLPLRPPDLCSAAHLCRILNVIVPAVGIDDTRLRTASPAD